MLTFLKLGGSLITDKLRAKQVRADTIDQIVNEIKEALFENPDIKLLIGHGSGSFGHVSAKQYNTRSGVSGKSGWEGFTRVWYDARSLNQYLVDAFQHSGLKLIAFPASASCICSNRKITQWSVDPIRAALHHGLIPLVNGDVVFDTTLGGTILSTEEQFSYLAKEMKPDRILLAGKEDGIWSDYPNNTKLLSKISPDWIRQNNSLIGESSAVDVTGGMKTKTELLGSIIADNPDATGLIFSGQKLGNIKNALLGENPGTLIMAKG